MRRTALKKLHSRAGESIAEVLVALLISAVAVAMLVGMIGVSTRIIDRSTQTMRKEYNKTSVTAQSGAKVTLVDGGSSVDSFDIVNQVHTDTSGSTSTTEIIYYTPKTS
jgi:hypothetical protein